MKAFVALPVELEARVEAAHREAAPLIRRARLGDVLLVVEHMFSLLGTRADVLATLRRYDFVRQAAAIETLDVCVGLPIVCALADGATITSVLFESQAAA